VLFAAIEQKPLISNNPDFSSILQVDGKLFGVTHFEAPTPATAYLSQYEQDAKTGAIKVSLGLAPLAATWCTHCCSSALQKLVAHHASEAPSERVVQRADMPWV
jgi:hypothetical protein